MEIKEFAYRKLKEEEVTYRPINFDTDDFKCGCGCGRVVLNDTLMQWLDDAHWLANNAIDPELPEVEFEINSAFRCKEHNEMVGGSRTSSHLTGKAVDIKCLNSRFRFLLIKALLDVGFERLGIGKTYIHADIDDTKDPEVVWLY
jgi:hypothetical protein